MDEVRTHLGIDRGLCGEPRELGEGRAVVELATSEAMVADDRGLVHGGFVFGALDYAAMLAVNDPLVVLGSADVRLTAPVRLGDTVRAEAELRESKGRKRVLEVRASVGELEVMLGTMTAFVLEEHVLASRED